MLFFFVILRHSNSISLASNFRYFNYDLNGILASTFLSFTSQHSKFRTAITNCQLILVSLVLIDIRAELVRKYECALHVYVFMLRNKQISVRLNYEPMEQQEKSRNGREQFSTFSHIIIRSMPYKLKSTVQDHSTPKSMRSVVFSFS